MLQNQLLAQEQKVNILKFKLKQLAGLGPEEIQHKCQ